MKYFALVLISTLTTSTSAADWTHWRGPHFNGSTAEQQLPTEFSRTENITWSVNLPGAAASTPIISGSRVFLSGIDAADDRLLAMCIDRATGRVLWQHALAKGTRRDYRSNFAAPSPTTDGKVVVFFFSNGDLIAYDFEGRQIWQRNIQEDYGTFAFMWTFSSSPLLFQGKLYVQVLQRDVAVDGRGFQDRKNQSYLLAIDPSDGSTLWQQFRPCDAVAESRESFSSPIPAQIDGSWQILVSGGDDLTGHDPDTGAELWRWGTWNPERIPHWRLVPSPVFGDGIVLACAPKRDPIYAIRLGASGQLSDQAIAWTSKDERAISSDVPTPAFWDGDFFILSDVRKSLSRVSAATGEVKWSMATPGNAKYEASPLVGDGKVYIVNFDGRVTIVDAADGMILEEVPMDDPEGNEMVRASLVAADGQLFIRTTRALHCVGQRKTETNEHEKLSSDKALDGEFVSMFNGRDLSGWEGAEGWWTVEDGVLLAESTPEKPCARSHYLYWTGGEPADFEFRCMWRISGHGNSGIQFRSEKRPNWDTWGYQADMDGPNKYTGCLYQHERGLVAQRGQRVAIDAEGNRAIETFATPEECLGAVNIGQWNSYRIVANGPQVRLWINDRLMCEVEDHQPRLGLSRGIIALQMHQGPPMKVEYKDLQIRMSE